MKYYIIGEKRHTDNTPEYGHGEWYDIKRYISLVVEADTRRKAMNKARKINPDKYFFSGIHANEVLMAADILSQPSIYRNGVNI